MINDQQTYLLAHKHRTILKVCGRAYEMTYTNATTHDYSGKVVYCLNHRSSLTHGYSDILVLSSIMQYYICCKNYGRKPVYSDISSNLINIVHRWVSD